MKIKRLIGAGLFLAVMAAASNAAAEFKPAFNIGYEFGGDELLDVMYTDGSTTSINAGDGVVLSGGAIYDFDPDLAVQVMIGWKSQSVTATNGEATFTRYPLDFFGVRRSGKHRFSGGITYHLSPELEGKGFLRNSDLSFDDAVGLAFHYDYELSNGMIWGLSYVMLDYTLENTGLKASANSFGLYLKSGR